MFIAHRGKVTSNALENTIFSFQNAILDPKYQGFELDVRTTKDGKFVVVHDFFDNGNLINKTLYHNLDPKIPLLEDVLKLVTTKIILLEIKEKNIDVFKLDAMLTKYAKQNIYVMSFYQEPIRKLLQLKPTYKCGILNYLFNSETSYQEYDFIVLLDNTITPNLLLYFERNKIEVFSYGIVKPNFLFPKEVYYIVDDNMLINSSFKVAN